MSRTTTLAVMVLFLAAGCTELPDVDRGVCGNHVLEAGEDCDGFAPEGASCVAAGTGNECRFECGATTCPEGWGCGLDGLCRRGGGFAETPLGPWSLDALTITAGDVDGDGRADVVGAGRAGVSTRFGAGDGRLDDRHDLPMRLTGPIGVGDMNGDGLTDVTAPIDIGMLAYVGSGERRLDAVPFAVLSQEGSGMLRVAAQALVGDFLPITYLVLIQQLGMCYVQFCDFATAVTLPPSTLDVDELLPPLRVELDAGGTSEELLLVSAGGTSLFIYEIERFNPGPGDMDRPKLRQTLDLPGPVLTRPLLADRNGDGRLDLMIGVDVGGELRVAAASGNLFGRFDAAAVDATFDGFLAAGCGGSRMPLAAADLSGDGTLEWVGDGGICLVLPLIGFVPYAVPRALRPLGEALIADLNRDGDPDVVAAYADIDALAVFLGSSGLLFNQTTVGTELLARELRIGDFDGNYIDDVAFVRPAGLAEDAGDEVVVLFGATDGITNPPQRMAGFGDIRDFLPIDFLVSVSTLDRATDLVVMAELPGGAGSGGGLLLGDSSRRMTSPLVLDGVSALAGATGTFTGPDQTLILAGAPAEVEMPITGYEVYVLQSEAGQFTLDAAPGTLQASGFAPACALPAAGDFDGDGLDEILLADHPAVGENCTRDPEQPAELDDGRLAYFDAESGDADVDTAVGLSHPGTIAVADVDVDGDADALVAFQGIDGAGDGLMVLRGGSGGLDLDGERLELVTGLRAVAAVDLAPGSPLALALIGDDELWLAEADGAGGWLDPVSLASLDPEGNASALIAGDVDGDGLDDLIVLRGSRVWVWLRQPGPLAGDTQAAPP